MKIIFISDTHGKHRKADIPDGDILIHGGDVTNGREAQMLDFLNWLAELPHTYKIFIGGNMDRMLEVDSVKYHNMLPDNTFYLENESLELEGLHIWGSPMIPKFVGAFNRKRGEELRAYWEKIPEDVDILITHTPPAGILDRTSMGFSVGCKELRQRVNELDARLHLFGHVHESYGREAHNGTTFINGSFVRGFYQHFNPPLEIEL